MYPDHRNVDIVSLCGDSEKLVHAEAKIVQYMSRRNYFNGPECDTFWIGISKLSCPMCESYMGRVTHKVQYKGCHVKVYKDWKPNGVELEVVKETLSRIAFQFQSGNLLSSISEPDSSSTNMLWAYGFG